MRDERFWAYAVAPAKGGGNAEPYGARVGATRELRTALDTGAARVKSSEWIDVDFEVRPISDTDGSRRSNVPRDIMLAMAFATDTAADDAAFALARRLALSTDLRTPGHLLVMVGWHEGRGGGVALWAFPSDRALRFRPGTDHDLEFLEDVFSRTSRLRKAAEFVGENSDSSFISGRVLDLVAGPAHSDVAQYWIRGFLECRFGVTPVIGTETLANAFKTLVPKLGPSERRTLTVAALALQQSDRPSWTIDEVATSVLPADLGERLRLEVEPHQRGARFALDRERFEHVTGVTRFELDNGVLVSSPLSEISNEGDGDKAVSIVGDELTARGTIISERLVAAGRRRA